MVITHGFTLLREEVIESLVTRARLLRHVKSGAELLSLENDDPNKTFGAAFRTLPEDSTGVAHVLEHCVLEGSRKYPLWQPLNELRKASLYTHLGALTRSDLTTFEVASTNHRDFYSLVDVYLDAIFHPLLRAKTFEQEAWHYELRTANEPLRYSGVVYNEMRGKRDTPSDALHRQSMQALFPDGVYRHNSGGDPAVITDLTLEQVRRFHARYYRPSNALLFFSGDDDPTERLRLLNAVLEDFDHASIDAQVPIHEPFSTPRRVSARYAGSADSAVSLGHHAMVTWALPEEQDPEQRAGLEILNVAICRLGDSPLTRGLIDSGLGQDVRAGLNMDFRQPFFRAGMTGIAAAEVNRVEALIHTILSDLAEQGVSAELVEAAISRYETSLRQQITSEQRGRHWFSRALCFWPYGQDPMAALTLEPALRTAQQRLSDDPDYLKMLLRTQLVNNQHRVTVTLEPDPDLARERAVEETGKLAAARECMTSSEVMRTVQSTRDRWQGTETQDTRESVALLPILKRTDLETRIIPLPIEISTLGEATVLYHNFATNGIVTLRLGFDLRAIPQELLPYVPFFGKALLEMGARHSRLINRKTVGISYSTYLHPLRGQPEGTAWLFLDGEATTPQTPELLTSLRKTLLTTNFDDCARFRRIVDRTRLGRDSTVSADGSIYVERRLAAAFSTAAWADEQIDSIDQLFFVRRLGEEVERDWPSVLGKLEDIRRQLVGRCGMIADVVVDASEWPEVRGHLQAFLDTLPEGRPRRYEWTPEPLQACEGLAVPAQVNFVGQSLGLLDVGYEYHGSLRVIANFIDTAWLWSRIRVQGGATTRAAVSASNQAAGPSYRSATRGWPVRCPSMTGQRPSCVLPHWMTGSWSETSLVPCVPPRPRALPPRRPGCR